MPNVICWKCKRSVEALTRRETDKKTKKVYWITYCPFWRCNANIEIEDAPRVKIWNQDKGFFEDET